MFTKTRAHACMTRATNAYTRTEEDQQAPLLTSASEIRGRLCLNELLSISLGVIESNEPVRLILMAIFPISLLEITLSPLLNQSPSSRTSSCEDNT